MTGDTRTTESNRDASARAREEWSAGSYPTLGRAFLPTAAALVDAVGVGPDDRVLDVACGTGNLALTAHRRGADVVGVDITPAMLATARERAATVDADVDWREGDAAALPFEDAAFDVTLSCLGHVFVGDVEATASELVRVTRPGGRIGYVSWTPTSVFAATLGAVVEHLPPDPDPSPPFAWGDPEVARERLGDRVADLAFETETLQFPAVSPAHFWETLTRDSGPVRVMLDGLDDGTLAAIRRDAVATVGEFFSEADNAVEAEYRVVTGRVP